MCSLPRTEILAESNVRSFVSAWRLGTVNSDYYDDFNGLRIDKSRISSLNTLYFRCTGNNKTPPARQLFTAKHHPSGTPPQEYPTYDAIWPSAVGEERWNNRGGRSLVDKWLTWVFSADAQPLSLPRPPSSISGPFASSRKSIYRNCTKQSAPEN